MNFSIKTTEAHRLLLSLRAYSADCKGDTLSGGGGGRPGGCTLARVGPVFKIVSEPFERELFADSLLAEFVAAAVECCICFLCQLCQLVTDCHLIPE